MTGRPDWAGTPLVHGAQKVFSALISVAAGATVSQYVQFSRAGYLVNVRPQYHAANGAVPFCLLQWRWVDSNPAVIDLGEQRWIVPTHAAGLYSPVLGRGPIRGPWALLAISNLDGAQPVDFFIDVWETTQSIARDDWRDSEIFGYSPPVGQVAAPNAKPSRNQLTSFNLSLFANTTYALPLYAGQAWLEASISPVAGGTVGLIVGPQISPGNAYNSGNVAGVVLVTQQAITLSREPHILIALAPATGGNFTVQLTTMEYAS